MLIPAHLDSQGFPVQVATQGFQADQVTQGFPGQRAVGSLASPADRAFLGLVDILALQAGRVIQELAHPGFRVLVELELPATADIRGAQGLQDRQALLGTLATQVRQTQARAGLVGFQE